MWLEIPWRKYRIGIHSERIITISICSDQSELGLIQTEFSIRIKPNHSNLGFIWIGSEWFALARIQISEWIAIVLIGSEWIPIWYFRQGSYVRFAQAAISYSLRISYICHLINNVLFHNTCISTKLRTFILGMFYSCGCICRQSLASHAFVVENSMWYAWGSRNIAEYNVSISRLRLH